MKKLDLARAIAMVALFVVPGCGGDASANINNLPISVTPSPVSVSTGQTQHFTAGAAGVVQTTGLQWGVTVGVTPINNIVTGGNTTLGTVSSSGDYTAPSAVPSPNKVFVVASSDGTGKAVLAWADVTITGNTGGGGGQTPTAAISVSPTSIAPGGNGATLTWSGTGSCLVDGQSTINNVEVGTGGSVLVNPSQTTTYTIACTLESNTVSAVATLTVQSSTTPPPPPSSNGVTVTATPMVVSSGGTVQLSGVPAYDPNGQGVIWTTSLGGYGPLPYTSGSPDNATYIAPKVTQTTIIIIKATAEDDLTSFGTVQITVNP